LGVKQGRIFFREIESCWQADRPHVVLDCSKVRHLDSAGIQVLLRCLEEAMKRNGDVKLAAIPPAAAAILEHTRIDRLFETFDNTADAVSSFHQFPVNAFQQAFRRQDSTLARMSGSRDGQSDSRAGSAGSEVARGGTTKSSGRWLSRQIAGCLVLLLVTPFAAASASPQQTNPGPLADASAPQAQSQNSESGAQPVNSEPFQPETLPNSPSSVRSQTVDDNRPFSAQQPSPNQPQSGTQEPVGTAAAQFVKTTGVAASKPAGAAIAPAKQRRARSILIKVGVIVGAGIAVGTVVALSSASPSRPR
jgi:anti-anti-sigma factor